MYLFCKFGFLYIRFTLSFSPEAFLSSGDNMPDHPHIHKVDDQGMASQISLMNYVAKTAARMQPEAAGAESRLTVVSIAWIASMFWTKKNKE